MTDDIEDIGQEAPVEAPQDDPSQEPARDIDSVVEREFSKQRERGPDGKFVKSEGKSDEKPAGDTRRGADKGVATSAPREQPRADSAEPRKTEPVALRAPDGFSVATKQAWDALPEHVKADIAKRETDFETGFKRFEGLGRFAHEAEKNGTTLQNAVSDYVAVETELRKDPVGGVEFLFKKMGLNPLGVLKAWLSRYAPAQGGDGQPAPQPQIDPNAIVGRAMDAVRAEFQQRDFNSQLAAYGKEIETFSADPANRFFSNVRQDMSLLVQAGKAEDLRQAYDAACWLHPEIRAILIEEMRGGQDKAATRTAARAQNAAKAVTGAPSPNSHASEPRRRRGMSVDEVVEEAFKAQRAAS